MTNNREYNQQQDRKSAEDAGSHREEQFNELSELSLEERMNAADQIGIPVRNVSETSALGNATGVDDAAQSPNGQREEETMGGKMDR